MSTFPNCDICGADDWPRATIRTGPHEDVRACQSCAEGAQNHGGGVVRWNDPWNDPHHEVNQPFEAHR
jgi:hypothetical protein